MPPTPAIAEAAQSFVRALAAERDLSPHTISAYRSDLNAFAEWAARLNPPPKLRGVERRMLRRYVAFLAQRGYARRTIARKVSTIRSLLAWAAENDLIAPGAAE